MRLLLSRVLAFGFAIACGNAFGQAPVKIGIVTTLSTAGGYIGEDLRDGMLLAIAEGGGTLGGIPVVTLVEDDKLKPADAKQIVERWIERENVKIFSGVAFSNIAVAVVPSVLDSGGIFVSSNSGPSTFAGAGCDKNYYVASWQNDNSFEAAGAAATKLGYKRMALLAPNYQAGKDAIAGFKRMYKGEVVEEIYTALERTDFAADITRVRAARADAVFQFHPGGQGIAFLKQWQQSGLKDQIPMVVAAGSLDQRIAAAVGDAAIGMTITSQWNTDFENPTNAAFVKSFVTKYGRTPTFYASQGYDTARLIGAALRITAGKIEGETFRSAMLKADVKLVRGAFRFNTNQHPIQDWYELRAVKDDDGKVSLRTVGKILESHADAYAKDCKL